MEMIKIALIGIAIGMANIIPGVSGGTIAVIFNIYDRFINAITYNVKKLWANRRFVIPLLLGMAAGVLLFSKLITVLYTRFPVQTNYFFTGLILGSIPMLFAYMMKKDEGVHFSVPKIISLIVCFAAGVALILVFSHLDSVFGGEKSQLGELPPLSVKLAVITFIAGIAGAVAMVIPGISGSLIMLMLGVYPVIITCIPALFNSQTFVHSLLLLLPGAAGILAGLISGAKLIGFLLRKAPNHTYAVIFGLICGSILTIFPGFKAISSVLMGAACVICLLAGAALAYFTSKFSKD